MRDVAGIVLSAGFGTRLKPFTDDLPKPLVPFLGKTPLWHQIMLLKKFGIDKIYVNLHYFPEMVEKYISENFKGIRTVFEPVILGTGGGIKNIIRKFNINTPVIVLNGDTISNINIKRVLEYHFNKEADATMLLRRDKDIPDENSVFIDSHKKILSVKRRPVEAKSSSVKCTFMGIHILNPDLFGYLPDEGCINKLAYPEFIANNHRVYGFVTEKISCDIGTIRSLYEYNMRFLSIKLTSPVFTRSCILKIKDHNNNIIDKNVLLKNSVIKNSIICDNCQIIDSIVEDSILFRNTVISNGNLKRCLANNKYQYII